MNLHTEKEFLVYSNYFSYKLRKLYETNYDQFEQIANFIPNIVYISKEFDSGKNSKYLFFNDDNFFCKAPEMQKLKEIGSSYLPKVSCNILLNHLKHKILLFKNEDDYGRSVRYLQRLDAYGKKTYILTNKLFLRDKNSFFHFSDKVSDLPFIGKYFSAVFEYYHNDFMNWQLLFSLTKQEKKVLKLLSQGLTNKEISETLFTSVETIKTHRKNIYKKLNISSTIEAVKIASIIELIE